MNAKHNDRQRACLCVSRTRWPTGGSGGGEVALEIIAHVTNTHTGARARAREIGVHFQVLLHVLRGKNAFQSNMQTSATVKTLNRSGNRITALSSFLFSTPPNSLFHSGIDPTTLQNLSDPCLVGRRCFGKKQARHY